MSFATDLVRVETIRERATLRKIHRVFVVLYIADLRKVPFSFLPLLQPGETIVSHSKHHSKWLWRRQRLVGRFGVRVGDRWIGRFGVGVGDRWIGRFGVRVGDRWLGSFEVRVGDRRLGDRLCDRWLGRSV